MFQPTRDVVDYCPIQVLDFVRSKAGRREFTTGDVHAWTGLRPQQWAQVASFGNIRSTRLKDTAIYRFTG